MTHTFINGELIPSEKAFISVQDRGFRYGDGVFETISIHRGVPYQFEFHIKRLIDGLTALKIAFDNRALQGQARELIKKNALSSGILRLQVTRGIGSRGYLPDPADPRAGTTLIMETAPLPTISENPVALWQSSYSKIALQALPVHYKLCQGLNSTLARMEAQEQHCADALLLNHAQQLCETSSGNIFWLKNGTVYTPSLDCGTLNGSTRAAIIRLSPLPVVETVAGIDALRSAEAVFMTNVIWQALPVGKLQPADIAWDSAGIANQYRQLLISDKDHYAQLHKNAW